MRGLVRVGVWTSAAMLALAAVVMAQASPLEGNWKLNIAKSKYSPGPPPKSQTIAWKRAAGGFLFTTDSVNADGQATHSETAEKDDGSDAQVKGAAAPTTRYLKRVDANTYEDGDKTNGKLTMTRRLVVAADGRSITITMKGTNAQGQPVNNVVVYEKQ